MMPSACLPLSQRSITYNKINECKISIAHILETRVYIYLLVFSFSLLSLFRPANVIRGAFRGGTQ